MKRSKVILLLLVLASMTGCLVSSLHPFYKDKDKYFDTTMVGYWMDGDSAIWTIFPNKFTESFMGPEKNDSTFRITYYEDEDHYSVLKGSLFRLNGVDYVDFFPQPGEGHCTSDLTSYHHVPVHTLARVQYCRDSILLYWYGDDWLNDLFEQQRIRIPHETIYDFDYDRHVLTAGTEELQKFILKYANDPKTVQDIEEIFSRGYAHDDGDYGVFLKLLPYDGPLPEREKKRAGPA